jgi:Tfp pilus assembly protein FimV
MMTAGRHRKSHKLRFFLTILSGGLLACGLLIGGAFWTSPVTVTQIAVTAPVTQHRITLTLPKAHRASQPRRKATYTVKAGQTLWSIAAAHCGSGNDYPALAKANHIANPDDISSGEVLVLACQ